MNGGIIYDLAMVQDRGTHWVVTNVTKNTLDNRADREESYLKLNSATFEIIKTAVNSNKLVKVNKTLVADEVMPWEVEVVDLGQSDPLQEARDASVTKIRMLVTPELSKASGMALYGFIVLNNDMASQGFFITNENREEKYLEVLETGDEKLISKLEDYLNYKDEIEAVAQLERKFSAFKNEIRSAATPEEVKKIEERFLERFYSNF
jgi:hypothetical protein